MRGDVGLALQERVPAGLRPCQGPPAVRGRSVHQVVGRSGPLSQVRAFFAVDLTSEVRARLAQAIASARSNFDGEPIRWVHAETLHLTLRFLGEAQPSTLEQLRRAAEERRAVWPAFSFEVRGLGCFPEARRPRVLWAGAVEPSGALGKIAADLEQLARAFGFPAEDRGFSAHLTIGRVKDRLSAEGLLRLSEWLQQSHSASFGTVPVESVELFKSDLKPSGPVYTRLGAFGLQT